MQAHVEISLSPFDEKWPALYALEATRIREALGSRIHALEHVGSTSVTDLVAKPTLDIVLGVHDSADEPSYVPSLMQAGYALRLREPEWFEHRLFNRPGADINLHVLSHGCEEIDNMIRFRDQLRRSSRDRRRYARVKMELSASRWPSLQHYADAKSEIVASILANADSQQ